MATTRSGENTAEAIRVAAIRLFNEHGYEATALRDLASEVGIKVGSLYNHIDSKQELLFRIMSSVMHDLLESIDKVSTEFPDPVDRLRAVIEVHVIFHAERADEVFVGNTELRSLSPVQRATIVEYRDAYEQRIRALIQECVESKRLSAREPQMVTYAIIAIGTHVSSWYDPRGRLTLAEIASSYTDFIFRALTNPEPHVELGSLLTNRANGSATR